MNHIARWTGKAMSVLPMLGAVVVKLHLMFLWMFLSLSLGCMGPKPTDARIDVNEAVDPEPYISERIDGYPAGCWATVEDYERATGKKIDSYHQSPYLDGRDLPPVEERLPEEPLVVKPIESIGKYGGTLRILTQFGDRVEYRNFMSPSTALAYDRDYSSVAPGLVKKWELSEDGRECTLYFRKGLKWSDGVPFTTDDVLFWWEDIIGNDELTPIKPEVWRVGGEMAQMTKIDDYTLRIRFKNPFPVIVNFIAGPESFQSRFYQCKHYMKQFHPNYVDKEALEQRVKSEGFERWTQYFKAKEGNMAIGDINRMECPTMNAYIVREKNLQTTLLERNPYFWKVDPEGNQLPYIDKVNAYYVESQEVYKLKVIAGEVDFDVGLYTLSVEDIPTLKKNEKKGGYRTLLWKAAWAGVIRLILNQNCPDPVKRELFSRFEFRKALSIALDRGTMNEVVLFNRGIPCQASVLPDPRYSKYYVEEYTKRHIEYDPDEANRILDELGLEKRDREGFRLMKDGNRVTLILSTHRAKGARGAFYELTAEYWRDVGVELIIKPVDVSVRVRRLNDGDYDIMSWHIDGISDIRFTISPHSFVPVTRANAWGPLWYRWYNSRGEEGEQPPPEVMELFKDVEIMHTTMDEEERIRAGKRILKSQADNLWSIGTVGFFSVPLVANKHLRNVPDVALWTWDHLHTAPLPPEAFYFDNL